MSQLIDISIILIAYNRFDLLENCLGSLINFTKGVNFEIIVVDNHSTEGNVEAITNKFEDVILIKNSTNEGFGRANNQGLRIAKGNYVLFLNNDTIFIENTIKKIFNFAESITEPVIVGCKLLNEDRTLQHSVYDFPSLLNVFASNFFLYALFPKSKIFNKYHLMNKKIENTCEVDVVTGAFLFGSRQLISELGGFDERFFFYNEETDLCYRFKIERGKIFYYPLTKLIHLKGGTANKKSWFAYKNQSIATIKYFQKHFHGLKFLLAVIIHFFGLLIRIPILFILGVLTFNQDLLYRTLCFIRLLFIYPKNNFI